MSFTYTGHFNRLNCSRLERKNFRKTAPRMPHKSPNKMNHGNCAGALGGNCGTLYHGSIPKKLRETVAATTEAHTSGAKRFMEKFPSTISEAKTAPVIGAL